MLHIAYKRDTEKAKKATRKERTNYLTCDAEIQRLKREIIEKTNQKNSQNKRTND